MTFQAVDAQIKELDTFDGFLDEFEQRCQSIKKGLCDVLQELKSTGNPNDPAYFLLERRFQISALGTKKRLQEKLRSMDRSALLHRRHIAQPSTSSTANSDSSQVDSLAADVTSSMTRTKQTLREEIDKSILSYQIMERSTKRLQATNKKQVELGSSGVLGRTRQAMRELWRRERADQFWITAAFGVFAAAALYVLSQRIWAPPVMVLVKSGWDLIMKKHTIVVTETTSVVLEEPQAMFTDLHLDDVRSLEEPTGSVETLESVLEVPVHSVEEYVTAKPVIEPNTVDVVEQVTTTDAVLQPDESSTAPHVPSTVVAEPETTQTIHTEPIIAIADSEEFGDRTETATIPAIAEPTSAAASTDTVLEQEDSLMAPSLSIAVPEATRVSSDEPILITTDSLDLEDPPKTAAATVVTVVEPFESASAAPTVTVNSMVSVETAHVDEAPNDPVTIVDPPSAVHHSTAQPIIDVSVSEKKPVAESLLVADSSMEDLVAAETYEEESEGNEDGEQVEDNAPLETAEDPEKQSQLLDVELGTEPIEPSASEPIEPPDSMEDSGEPLDPTGPVPIQREEPTVLEGNPSGQREPNLDFPDQVEEQPDQLREPLHTEL